MMCHAWHAHGHRQISILGTAGRVFILQIPITRFRDFLKWSVIYCTCSLQLFWDMSVVTTYCINSMILQRYTVLISSVLASYYSGSSGRLQLPSLFLDFPRSYFSVFSMLLTIWNIRIFFCFHRRQLICLFVRLRLLHYIHGTKMQIELLQLHCTRYFVYGGAFKDSHRHSTRIGLPVSLISKILKLTDYWWCRASKCVQ